MKLTTDRLVLQEITWDDLEDVHLLESFREVDEYNTIGIPKNMEETRKNIKPYIEAKNRTPQKNYTWIIKTKMSNSFIGIAGMSLSLDRFKLGEIFYKLIPEYWGKGYATEVSKKIIQTGFEVFDLHKIEAGVATENIRSIRVLEKLGMTREGLRRKILPIRGEWKDNYHYAIVEDDPRDY